MDDAIAAERSFEAQLRHFSMEGDDPEVQGLFAELAAAALLHSERMAESPAVSNDALKSRDFFSEVLAPAPKARQDNHVTEERLAQNLIMAFALAKGGCAMYKALEAVARVSAEERIAGLAQDLSTEQNRAAERIWHFLPSRSKIAFNVLTAGEIDPAIETRAPDDRILDGTL